MMRLPEAPAPGDYPLHPTVLTTVAVSSTIPSNISRIRFRDPWRLWFTLLLPSYKSTAEGKPSATSAGHEERTSQVGGRRE